MNDLLTELLLWLLVLNLGIAFGAGLYEHRISLAQWFPPGVGAHHSVNLDAMRTTDSGRRFWAFVTTGPLTLLTLASLFIAPRADAPVRDWWLAAACVVLAERVFTFAYFIPTALRLMRAGPEVSPEVEAAARRWRQLNQLRALLTLAGWLASLRALALT